MSSLNTGQVFSTMSVSSPEEMEHEFFTTLKRYAERLNDQKNLSLTYLQQVNRLTAQLRQKDEEIAYLIRQNSELKEKLNLFQSVMARSRISNNPNKMSQMRMSSLISKENYTDSVLQTKVIQESKSKLRLEDNEFVKQAKSSMVIEPGASFLSETQQIQNIQTIQKFSTVEQSQLPFPVFEEFFIIRPSQNKQSGKRNQTSNDLKFVFSLNKTANKTWEGLSSYVSESLGPKWLPKEHKNQSIVIGKTTNNGLVQPIKLGAENSHTNDLILYLANSDQTLNQNSLGFSAKGPFSHHKFNPSLYFYGISIRYHTLEYINGKLYKVPLIFGFVTRYPLLRHFTELIKTIHEKLNVKSQIGLQILQKQLNAIRQRKFSLYKNPAFEFTLFGEKTSWEFECAVSDGQIQFPHSQQKLLTIQNLFNYEIELKDRSILNTVSDIFEEYSIELIVDVLLLLLLEIPVAVVSRDEVLLGKFMFLVSYLFKPLKYPFPIIFNLPSNMKIVLESPFPSFIGSVDFQMIEPFMYQRAVFDLDEKIAKSWPNLDFYNESRNFVLKELMNIGQNDECLKVQRLTLVTQMIIDTQGIYREIQPLTSYRQIFEKTEIFNLYRNCDH